MQLKRSALVVVAIFALVYCAIAFSPLRAKIGRSNPQAASLFSPLLFNFSEKYTDGEVLGFSIGMDKESLFDSLKTTSLPNARILRNCAHDTIASTIVLSEEMDMATAYGGGDSLCMYFDPRTSVIFEFDDRVVSTIEIAYVRTELP